MRPKTFASAKTCQCPDQSVTSTKSCACCRPWQYLNNPPIKHPPRPTPELATEARLYFARPEILGIALDAIRHELGENGVRHFETILAVVEPPTDEEIDGALASFLDKRKWHEKLHDRFMFGAGVRHFLGPVKP